jgi:hypothetical protein
VDQPELPPRYETITRLGQGGGGEVWAVRDRFTGREYALKLLAREAGPRELAALVREAVALSGLEGLGMPRVQRFGRLSREGRPFMLRELVEGEGLEELVQRGAPLESLLAALARAADQLTLVHRAGFLHGDVKPGNVIVEPGGAVTFVDLGLAAPWREGGAPAEGLTPRYAAPELFEGRPLTVRAEVFALGITLQELVEAARGDDAAPPILRELGAVAERATAQSADQRYPSVDEFAIAVRRASGMPSAQHVAESSALWPIVGIDGTSSQLVEAALALAAGQVLRLSGPPLSGRSALLWRLAWSLGAEGAPLAYVEDAAASAALAAELDGHATLERVFVLVDDADALEQSGFERLERARAAGARLVLVGGARFEQSRVFDVPPLDERAAIELVRRAMPSLTDTLQKRVVELSGGRPGELRR